MTSKSGSTESAGPLSHGQRGSLEGAGPSVIAADLSVTGEVLSEGQIEIYGTVQGKVNSKRLTVEEGALIKGSIVAEEVRIRGAIQGPITANSVVMDSTASVEGSIFHHVLSAHPESVHRGRKPWRLRPLEECSEL